MGSDPVTSVTMVRVLLCTMSYKDRIFYSVFMGGHFNIPSNRALLPDLLRSLAALAVGTSDSGVSEQP